MQKWDFDTYLFTQLIMHVLIMYVGPCTYEFTYLCIAA